MTSNALDRLGTALADRYRIDRELGQGGMATVYLAEDLKHRRKVAIKVLHPELSAVLGTDRFLKEIELTASLQHPHILPLFDSGAADGLLYYVMPYVEGESLRSRLARDKQLPIADAVRITGEVASALDYAHRRGVVHRDIKPENILLHDGRAVVADFGIALAVAQAGGSRMTQTGLSLGTPQYMSPEQAMGEREITPRSDLYALGCVAYEMLTGEPPFSGATAQAIVARVLTETPRAITPQRHTVPEHVEAAVLIALEKLPADRFASAADFATALQGGAVSIRSAATRPTGTAVAAPPSPAKRLRQLAPWALAAAGLLLAGWALLTRREPKLPRVIRYSVTPRSSDRVVDVGGTPVLAKSDGSGLIYLGFASGRPRQLRHWDFDSPDPVPIPETENAAYPFLSPDGEWVGYLIGGQLRKARIGGGGVSTIGSAGSGFGSFRGATWTSNGTVVYATSSGLFRIPATGGTAARIPLDSTHLTAAFFPTALPDGEHVVVTMLYQRGSRPSELAVVSLADGRVTLLGQDGSNPRYVDPGFLVFTNTEGALLAVRFDPRRHKILGSPRQIAQGMAIGAAGVGKFDVSPTGVVVYLEGVALEERQVVRVDRSGVARALEAPPRSYNGPRISPDGKRIAVTIGAVPNPPMDIWVYELGTGTLSRVTYDSTSVHAEWSADGKRLYHRQALARFRATATTPDGSTPPESLYTTASDLWEIVATRSGDTLITRELRGETDRDLMLIPLRPAGPPVPWAAGPRIQAEPALSPDGKWLAYSSDESGAFEVYVRAFPGPGPRYPVSNAGGTSPRWNRNGSEIFYLSIDSLIAVPLLTRGATLELGRRKALFQNSYAPLNFHAPYDVAPDGSWFVFVGVKTGAEAIGFRLVHNWFEQPWK